MVATSPQDRASDDAASGLVQRLSDGRWLIVALAAVLVILTAFGWISFAAALGIIVALVALVAVLPRARPIRRAALEAAPVVSEPDGGVRAFAEALPDPCFVLDRRGLVHYANERAVAAYNIKAGESLTFRLRNPDLTDAFARVARGGPPERVEFAERIPTERWSAGWFASLGRGKGSGDFIILTLADLTEQRRTDRIRVDFVANASHELRTPLASLAGFIETLQGPARDDEKARARFLEIMRDQATRMSRLVDDLLSLSRIEMKAHVRPVNRVDLVGTIRHVTDALEPLAQELGVTIETDLPEGEVELIGDRDELIQVFENLVENACKYGQSGKRVVVTLTQGEDRVGATVSVRDFGPGIPEEHVPRLTERFYRVDVEASRKHRGTGLGLAIVKHILARHHARLKIESKFGEGAEFKVSFPQAYPPAKG